MMQMITKADRQRRDDANLRAEIIGASLLHLKGSQMLAQCVKSPVEENGMITRRTSDFAFIEVRAQPAAANFAGGSNIHAKMDDPSGIPDALRSNIGGTKELTHNIIDA